MAQTIDAVCDGIATIELSSNGTTWTNYSGSISGITDLGQDVNQDVEYTLDGDYPIICTGKMNTMTPKIRGLYTETAGEAFELLRAAWENKTPLYMRFSPKGVGASGRFVFTAANSNGTPTAFRLSSFMYPGSDATSAKPIAFEASMQISRLVKTTTASSTGLGS